MIRATCIFSLLIAISCTNYDNYVVGTWELNENNNISTLKLDNDHLFSHYILGNQIGESKQFHISKISKNKFDIIAGQGNNCEKFTFEKLSNNLSLGCNYKCWIDSNLIDEVFIARKNQSSLKSIQKAEQEQITIPYNYEGKFFIIYQESKSKKTNKISINDKGLGINTGSPELKHLFNANRVFRMKGVDKEILIANPDNYHNYLNKEFENLGKPGDFIIIQQGFNQTGRDDWNKENGMKIGNNLNIEYFEVRKIK